MQFDQEMRCIKGIAFGIEHLIQRAKPIGMPAVIDLETPDIKVRFPLFDLGEDKGSGFVFGRKPRPIACVIDGPGPGLCGFATTRFQAGDRLHDIQRHTRRRRCTLRGTVANAGQRQRCAGEKDHKSSQRCSGPNSVQNTALAFCG